MEEFIENFCAFRKWLFEQDNNCTDIWGAAIKEVQNKFESLNLKDIL